VRDEIEKFQRAGVQPFGVNPADVESHAKYVEKLRFNFPLLSDPDRSIARSYQSVKDDGRGIIRTVYLITREGTVAFAQRGTPAVSDIVASVARGG
jgi:peroxiredoxin Q/BCP